MGILFITTSCSNNQNTTTTFSYKPPILPITFNIDSDGHISIDAEASISTPLGDFGIDESVPAPQVGTTVLAILHNQNHSAVKTGYQIKTGGNQATVASNDHTDDHTEIPVINSMANVDARGGPIKSVTVASREYFSTPLSTFCFGADQQSLTLHGFEGDFQSDKQYITITNCAGFDETWTTRQTTDDGTGWIRTTDVSGTLCSCSSQSEAVSASLVGLAAGRYTGTLDYYVGSHRATTVTINLIVNY